MPSLAVGTDLVEVKRIADLLERHGERFAGRIFTPDERAACAGSPDSLAARWAAKEATAKALGTGIGEVAWTEIEIVQDEVRRPALRLHGKAAALAGRLGLNVWSLSLAHDGGMALAFVVALGPEG